MLRSGVDRVTRALFLALVAAALAIVPAAAEDGFDPARADLVIIPGGSETIEKTLHLDALPEKADVVLAIDTTASMALGLKRAKEDAAAIVTAVQDKIPGARFAVVEFKDYPSSLDPSDYPYLRRQSLTADSGLINEALANMEAKGGGDPAESHNRVVFETLNDADLDRDPAATLALVVLSDQIPHDENQNRAFKECPSTPPTDLGTEATLNLLKDAGATLSFVSFESVVPFGEGVAQLATDPGVVIACQKQLAEYTGGRGVDLRKDNERGMLAGRISDLVEEAAQRITSVRLDVRPERFASWVTTTPPTPFGPFTAPIDLKWEETITVPPGTAPGTYEFQVVAMVDGAERATQQVRVDVRERATSGLKLTVDQEAMRAGIATLPVADIPADRIPFFAGSPSTQSAPVGSIPVGSIPVGSIPVGSIGLLNLASIPVGSIGLDTVLLSQLGLKDAAALAQILAAFGNRPPQTITLRDIAGNATARAALNAVELRQISFASSLLRDVSLAVVLLGNLSLKEALGNAWCAALTAGGGSCAGVEESDSLLGVAIAGKIGSTPVGSIPVGSIPVGSIPVGSIPVGSIDIARTRLASVPVGSIANRDVIVNCSVAGFNCATDTLGRAQQLNAIRASATLADLTAVLASIGITLSELVAALVPLDFFPWHLMRLDGNQDLVAPARVLDYHAEFDLACAIAKTFSVRVGLAGAVPVRGSVRYSYGDASSVAGENPTRAANGYVFADPPGDPCSGTQGVRRMRLDFKAFEQLRIGTRVSSLHVTANNVTESASAQAPVLVLQNHEQNEDPATAPVIQKNTLVVGHVASSDDVETFRFPIPAAPRSRVTAYLSGPEDADFDLEIEQPTPLPLQSSPVGSIPVGSIPIEDRGADADNEGVQPPPETLQDVPVGSIPVGSISATRESSNEQAQVLTNGESGHLTIRVFGYNGDYSTEPFVLNVTVTPPPPLPACDARGLSVTTQGTLPAGLPAATKTLFLVNYGRMNALYGAAAVSSMLASIGDQLTPGTLAARPEVAGSVLQVDGDADVRGAYAAWDSNPCSVNAANDVVRKINNLVSRYRSSLPNLRYVVLLGSDEAIPHARDVDLVEISPELDEAGDLAFTTQGLTKGNALYAAAATNHVLTDAAYTSFTRIEFLGRELYLPQVPVARVVETPAEIKGQMDQYHLVANGVLDPSTAYTTGYDFLVDGATDVSQALAAGGLATTLQVSESWNAATLESEFYGASPVPDVGSINAHYSHYLAQTAAGALVSSAIVPGPDKLAGRMLFTMGCHAGLNVSNTLPGDAAKKQDWAQEVAASRAAVYVAHLTFGYGDSEANALSERLMTLFAQRIAAGVGSVGDQWLDALHTYFLSAGTAYGVYDRKVLSGANFFGLPFYTYASPGTLPPAQPLETTTDGPLTLQTLTVAPTSATVSSGGSSFPAETSTQFAHYRPLVTVASTPVGVPGATVQGAFIKGIATQDVSQQAAVLGYPTIDLKAHEPKPNFDATFFPASIVGVTRGPAGNARVVVAAEQFRPAGGGLAGVRRVVNSVALEVASTPGPLSPPPRILQTGAVSTGASSATVFVRVKDDPASLRQVAALVNDGTWRYVQLSNTGGGLWTAAVSGLAAPPEIIAEAQKKTGAVGFSTNKGFNFTTVSDTGKPEVLVESPTPGRIYLLNQDVDAIVDCSDPGAVASCDAPAKVDTSTVGDHTFVVTATDLAGNQSTIEVDYEVRFAFQGFFSPLKNPPAVNSANAGLTVPLKWGLLDANGAPYRSLDAVTSISSVRARCPSAPADPLPDVQPEDQNLLRYDTSAEQFIYNLRTLSSWAGTCRQIYVGLADGTNRSVIVSFQ